MLNKLFWFTQSFNITSDSALSSKCVGEFIVQNPVFGILTNPGYPGNPHGLSQTCYWAIYPNSDLRQEVDLVIHEAFTLDRRDAVCYKQYLQVWFDYLLFKYPMVSNDYTFVNNYHI